MGKKKAARRGPSDRTLRKRLALYIEARAILSVAALASSSLFIRKHPMSYRAVAKTLAFQIRDERKAAELADAIYSDAVGPDEWTPESEERALARCNTIIRSIRDDLGMEDY
ncbi:MAG: hypothetical protein AB7E70_19580 [Hyphomicrobiaceae bacterium]